DYHSAAPQAVGLSLSPGPAQQAYPSTMFIYSCTAWTPLISSSASQPDSAQKSWVGCHFNLNHKTNKFQCLAPNSKKKGKPCGVIIFQDLTSSTKSMSEHLKRVHHMVPPNQDQTNQLLLPNLIKHQLSEHCVSYFFPRLIFNVPILTAELLQQDQLFSSNMYFSHKSINNVIDQLHISFTVDAWTSPNMKAFMAVTVHGINPDWKMIDLLIGMPAVGIQVANLGNILVYILDDLELSNKLISITADNASRNSTHQPTSGMHGPCDQSHHPRWHQSLWCRYQIGGLQGG
ncbi:uncharacterized protein VP01_4209g3, partial [Puccinia sorghi]